MFHAMSTAGARGASSVVLGALAVSALLACAGSAAADPRSLAPELFAEGDWRSCRLECSRLLQNHPGDNRLRLLKAVSELRLGIDGSPALLRLSSSDSAPPEVRASAHYALGRALWDRGAVSNAFVHLCSAFDGAVTTEMFLRAGCSLGRLLDGRPHLAEGAPGLRLQLRASAPLWSPALRKECTPGEPAQPGSWVARPVLWLIALYGTQVSPATGERCSLHPSCSEYARQAIRKHGLLGLPIYADRNVREPDVVSKQDRPVVVNGRRKFADPIEEHDWWWDRGQRSEVRGQRSGGRY